MATMSSEHEGEGQSPQREPADVPVVLVADSTSLDRLSAALASAVNVAIDTETCMRYDRTIGPMRVLSVACRDGLGHETSWVVDARDFDVTRLAPLLAGVRADAWNANFDARVIDDAVFRPAGFGRERGITWWDAMLADAVLHQGMTGFTWFHGLAWATQTYLGFAAQGKGTVQTSFDAESDLSEIQISYAAADAVETLWVADCIRERLSTEGLVDVAELEMSARPLLDHMERHGLPVDWNGWLGHLDQRRGDLAESLARISSLTGGGQGNLFDATIEPSFNPGSERQAKVALNTHSREEVATRFLITEREARLLKPDDRLDATTLREIGGPLAQALLDYREHTKVLTTYGENLAEYVDEDGRMRPQYVQVVGANTGRLSSRRPNAQNLAPQMKAHLRPSSDDRVFVHADLSQAELRWLAQVAGDDAMQTAFRTGVDIHVATAERMFGVDMAELSKGEPDRWKSLRAQAKTINFGIVYGQGARALGRTLTLAGTETSAEEAGQLLKAYRRAYPDVASWLASQDQIIRTLVDPIPAIDWPATLRLHGLFGRCKDIRRRFRDEENRWPSPLEITEIGWSDDVLGQRVQRRLGRPATEAELASERTRCVAAVTWATSFEEAIILQPSGEPIFWSAHTLSGRRRQFNVHTDGVLGAAAHQMCRVGDQSTARALRRFAERHDVALFDANGIVSDYEIRRIFEHRALRRTFIDDMIEDLGLDGVTDVLGVATVGRIERMSNAFRNAPIQGGVADAMLAAYGRLWERLAGLDDVWPVQTVHDSIVLECPRSNAAEVSVLLKTVMEEAFESFCPDVAPLADADIRTSLADDDILETVD